ncbi:MAG: M6 family metalloprotease domain-containing protein [Candidatus Syntrophosphaera sp.]|nr:M6 family metalloprotease domain-containing protein [Candidatus Syntrophosphaera sp.]
MKVLALLALLLSFAILNANFVKNQPLSLEQPDGSTYAAFVTGDEFHRNIHDGENYTIMLDPATGYYVYALPDGDSIRPSEYVAGSIDPSSLGIPPKLRIDPRIVEERIAAHQAALGTPDDRAPTTGTINNIFIFVRFADQSEYTGPISDYVSMCNSTTGASMRGYFLEESNSQLTINTTFYPAPVGGIIRSFQDSHNRGYFLPWSASNTIGYTTDTQGYTRLQTMMRAAIVSVSGSIPAGLNVDGDGDGNVDNITFVAQGNSSGIWNSPLWPHHWTLHLVTAVYINTKRVWDYNLQFSNSIARGVICHEMSHTLGFPDLYHYSDDYDHLTPVGSWDLMEWDAAIPQHHLTYMKWKYGNWFTTIPTITPTSTPTTYTLTAIDQNPFSCYKIASTNPNQFYVLEYRRKTGTYENSIPASGILVSRIITVHDGTTLRGNSNGPPDEVYLYRPGGTVTLNGTINSAHFSSNVSRTAIHTGANPEPWLYVNTTTQSVGNLVITDISSSGGTTMTFKVRNSVPNVWDGSSSTNWHTGSNWSLNSVPTSSQDVIIPSGLTNYPVVSSNANAKNLELRNGASLSIGGVALNVANNADISGSLTLSASLSDLYVGGDLFFRAGSTASIPAGGYIFVQSDVEFHTSINLASGYLRFYGNGNSFIRTYTASTIAGLSLYKTTGYVAVSNLSTSQLTINGSVLVYGGNILYHSYSGTTVVKGNFTVYADAACSLNSGTISMEGNASRNITLTDAGSYFNNLRINKDSGYTVNVLSNIEVRGNLTINGGVFNANDHTLTVKGDWINTLGQAAFTEGTSRVIFAGDAHQYCNYSENFNILETNCTAALRVNSSTAVVTCAEYDWTAGAIDILAGTFTANDLSDNGIAGGWYLNAGGTINLYNIGGWVDLRGDLHIFGGEFNVYGGTTASYWPFASNASLSMSGGVLDFKDQGIYIYENVAYTFTENITGGTIRVARNIQIDRSDFTPTGGLIEMVGSMDASVSHWAGSNLYSLKINKQSTREESALIESTATDKEGNVIELTRANTVNASSDLDINGYFMLSNGTFVAPAQMNVRGSWYNYVGEAAFNEGTGLVVFDGNASTTIYATEVFNAIELNKTSSTLNLNLQSSRNLTCNSYNWTQGGLNVTGGTFTALDLVDSGVMGTVNLTSGTINYHQDAGQYIDLRGTITIEGGTFNIHGGVGPAWFSYIDTATLNMSGGILDFKDVGIFVSAALPFNDNISGGTIRTTGNFVCNRSNFNPTGGILEMYGSVDRNISHVAGANLNALKINKSSTRDGIPEALTETDRNGRSRELTRSNTITASSDLDINGDLTLQAGVLSANTRTLNVGGNWINNAGTAAFNAGTSTVVFDKASLGQNVSGTTNFHNVTDSHFGNALAFQGNTGIAGTLTVGNIVTFSAGGTMNNVVNTVSGAILAFYGTTIHNIASYTGGGSLRAWSNSHVVIADLTQNGLYGSFIADTGHLEFHQGTDQYNDVNGDMTIANNGIVDIYGGSMDCYIGYTNPITFTLSSGEFNVKDRGIWLTSTNSGDYAISGGTIRANGNFFDNRGSFDPTGGTVELTGSGDNTVTLLPTSWFWTLKVNKLATRESGIDPMFETDREGNVHPITRTRNLTINECTVKGGFIQDAANVVSLGGTLTVSDGYITSINGGLLQTGGYNLVCTGNLNINGTLLVSPGSSLMMSHTKNVNINSGGEFLASGTSTQAATVTHNVSGYYGFNVESGATVGAAYTVFEYMSASGINVKTGSLVNTNYAFDYCTFRLGLSGGRLLQINNSQSFTVTGAFFPTNTWSGAYNVTKTADSGLVYFAGWSGPFGGPAFEQDSYNRVWWEGSGVPPIGDLAISYVPSTNRIQLNWTYPLAVTEFRIYRASTPDGTFSQISSTTGTSWSQIVPGDIYFYRVTAIVP